jgi:hypothetical protein
MPIIFRKTAKGFAEIETRANRLVPRVRNTLILVDGKRDVEDLKLLVAQHTDEALRTLAELGFIEAVGETLGVAEPAAPFAVALALTPTAAVAVTAAAASASAVAPSPAVAVAFPPALGASAASLAIRIEKARSAEELKPLVSQAVQLVVAARGRNAADAFATRMPML